MSDSVDESRKKLSKVMQFNNVKMTLAATNEVEILKIINCLKSKMSTGWDEIPTNVIKRAGQFISRPLADIINFSFLIGSFPTKASLAIIKPLYKKKGSKTDMTNFRPLSLLPVFSKIIEQAFLYRLNDYLNTYNVITCKQHGFRKKCSTTTASFSLVHSVVNELENKNITATLMCDLSKAFDTISHDILMMKLEHYGISGVAGDWIKSYLSGRQHRVQLSEDAKSNWEFVKHGIPQGSILGPVLFSIYVNDLVANMPENICDVVLYADDTSVIVKGTSETNLVVNIKIVLCELEEWFTANKLKLNGEKTNLMRYQPNGALKEFTLDYNEWQLKAVEDCKFLGITIDYRLKWFRHIEQLCKKLSSSCFALRTIANQVSINTCKTVYFANFQSHVQYGILLWGASSKAEKIFIYQKKAVRIIGNLHYNASCRNLFRKLNILTVPCLYILNVLLFKWDNPQLFLTNSQVHDHATRGGGTFRSKKNRLQIADGDPINVGTYLFNNLPSILKMQNTSRVMFKKNIESFLISHTFYTINEFINASNCRCDY